MSRRAPPGVSLLALAAALAGLPLAASAQSTAVVVDVGNSRALGTTVTTAGTVLTIDGGTRAGGNLFHSFQTFSLGAGDTARWTRSAGDGATVNNVISRVTGGQVSQISGTLDSTALPSASFFFINPAGIVFGAGAQVNVPATAYFSTAADVRFAGGGSFAVAAPNGSTLSVAAPESFGFVGGQGDIIVDRVVGGFAGPMIRVGFFGADVRISGSDLTLGSADIVAAGRGAFSVRVADPLAAPAAGVVSIGSSRLFAPGNGGIRINGGSIALDATRIVTESAGATRVGDVSLVARGMISMTTRSGISTSGLDAGLGGGDIVLVADEIRGTRAAISSLNFSGAAGGDVRIEARTINLDGRSFASSSAFESGSGGFVTIAARESLTLEDMTTTTLALGSGRAGDITLSAPTVTLDGGSAYSGSYQDGPSGDVRIRGGTVVANDLLLGSVVDETATTGSLEIVATERFRGESLAMSGRTLNPGITSRISIVAPDLVLRNSTIDVSSEGNGSAGTISLRGDRILLDRSFLTAEALGSSGARRGSVEVIASGDIRIDDGLISSTAFRQAEGGTVTVRGANITLDGGQIGSDSFGSGRGGRVEVAAAGTLEILNGADVSADALDEGDAGDVVVSGARIRLDEDAAITSTASNIGDAGSITVTGGDIRMTNSSGISSDGKLGRGDAGTISVTADSLYLRDSYITSDALSLGRGGSVSLRVGALEMDGGRRGFTYLSSQTLGLAPAGDVSLTARSIVMRDQAYISSETFGNGSGGRVSIASGSLEIIGDAYVASDSRGPGDAGEVSIKVERLTMRGETGRIAYISSDAFGGDAGRVRVEAGTLVASNAVISSDTYAGGDAGDVTVVARDLSLDAASVRSGTFNVGAAGEVQLTAATVRLDQQAQIASEAFRGATGPAGRVLLTADSVDLIGGASITTVSGNRNRAGSIQLNVGRLDLSGGGTQITSANRAGDIAAGYRSGLGDAGEVRIAAGGIRIADGAQISTSAFAGAAGEINIRIERPGLLVLKGDKAPGVIQTSSGAGTGGKITIADPLAIISNGGSIQALGQQRGANVVIQSRYFINSTDRANTVEVDGEIRLQTGLYDVSSGTVSRDLSVLDASKVLRGQCPAARSTGAVSQLITRPVGPYIRETSTSAAPAAGSRTAGAGACR